MAPRRLLVVLYGEVIGRIDQRSPIAEPEFTYDQDYVHAGSTPLGVRMPVADTTYRGRSVRAFLDGLLPESRSTRSRWGTRLGVDPDDAAGLDCTGVAVSIGGRRKFGQVLGKHWDRCAATLRIPAAQFRDRVRTLAEGFPDAFSDALRAVETPEATAIRQRTTTRIATHIEQLIKRLDDPPEPTNTRRRAHGRTRPERP
jgi:HipA-like protein